MTDNQVPAPAETVALWHRYTRAKDAKSSWTAEEKAAKEALLLALGYDADDEKPEPCRAVSDTGEEVFEVTVGSRTGLDTKYFRANYPDVYAACEKTTHPISIREVAE